MEIGSKPYLNLALSAARLARIDGSQVRHVNCGSGEDVDRAREAITHMGMWDSIVDWAFDGEKGRVLNAIADVVLYDKAAAWQRKYPGHALDERLRKLDRVEAQLRLMDLLSPEGRRVMLADHVETPDTITFHPTTDTVLDSLLTVTLQHDHGKALLDNVTQYTENGQISVQRGFPNVDEAWQDQRAHVLAGNAWMRDAQVHRNPHKFQLAASAHVMAAWSFSAVGYSEAAASAWANAVEDKDCAGEAREAARLVGELAQHWQNSGRHDLAAKSWGSQAKRYQDLNLRERAAEAWGRQAHCAENANLHDVAQTSWLAQASIYRSLDWHDRAQECEDKAAQQGELDKASQPPPPPDVLREIASHLGPADVMSLARVSHSYAKAIVSSQDSVRRVLRSLDSLTPSEYIAQIDNGLPILGSLDPGSRLEPLQNLVARLDIVPYESRERAFNALLSTAADLPAAARCKLLKPLSRKIGLLRLRGAAWDRCFNTIAAVHEYGSGRSATLAALADTLILVPVSAKGSGRFTRMLGAVADFSPEDPDKGPALMGLASCWAKHVAEPHHKLVVESIWSIVDDVRAGDSFRTELFRAMRAEFDRYHCNDHEWSSYYTFWIDPP